MFKKHRVLIIDDEPDILELLQITLERMGLESEQATNLKTAKEKLAKKPFDLCLTDMRLPGGDGTDFVVYTQTHFPNMPIAILTAHGSMESAIFALKAGAFDFISKPVDLNMLRVIISDALKPLPDPNQTAHQFIGTSKVAFELKLMIEKIAKSQAPVYINGESGTGKELVARMIHENSPRMNAPFIPINCGAIPNELMENEFFGHKKGSFTGATQKQDGLFKAADGGTLFLDEITELPQYMQVKLLRAIQERSIRPIGSEHEFLVDVRIVSATNSNLEEYVEKGLFREDLFYRINVIGLHVPPLRKRKEDISIIANHKLARINETLKKSVQLSPSAIDKLCEYHFPGNVRELENILERAVALSNNSTINAEDLNLSITKNNTFNPDEHMESNQNLDNLLVDIERQQIVDALEKTRWNKTEAAKLLGISFRALRYRLNKLNIN